MISIIITAFKEPETIGRAVEAITKQQINKNYELIVACPDEETWEAAKKISKKVKRYKDPGKGKSFALNKLFKIAKGDILILTDGDVYLGNNAINEITKPFKNKNIACVTGRIISTSNKNTMPGYWSHLLADAGAHEIRKELALKGMFLECSGYLFAFRNQIKEIPVDVAEDTFIPYIFWKQGNKIAYASKALVFVKNPNTIKDFIKQRKRTAGAHETLTKYAKDFPRVKSFKNEIKKGTFRALAYPSNLKELIWTFTLFPIRFYIWVSLFYDQKVKNKWYQDAWERVESTK